MDSGNRENACGEFYLEELIERESVAPPPRDSGDHQLVSCARLDCVQVQNAEKLELAQPAELDGIPR